jgi:hypothetical protein
MYLLFDMIDCMLDCNGPPEAHFSNLARLPHTSIAAQPPILDETKFNSLCWCEDTTYLPERYLVSVTVTVAEMLRFNNCTCWKDVQVLFHV